MAKLLFDWRASDKAHGKVYTGLSLAELSAIMLYMDEKNASELEHIIIDGTGGKGFRKFTADLATGKLVLARPDRKRSSKTSRDVSIFTEMDELMESGMSRELAAEKTAGLFKVSEDVVMKSYQQIKCKTSDLI
jgi:hypothetical protein